MVNGMKKRVISAIIALIILTGIVVVGIWGFNKELRFAQSQTITINVEQKVDDTKKKNMYILAGLAVISFIVSLFIFGYQYDIVKYSIDKKADLPAFSDILGMLIRGIKYFIVIYWLSVIYCFII